MKCSWGEGVDAEMIYIQSSDRQKASFHVFLHDANVCYRGNELGSFVIGNDPTRRERGVRWGGRVLFHPADYQNWSLCHIFCPHEVISSRSSNCKANSGIKNFKVGVIILTYIATLLLSL